MRWSRLTGFSLVLIATQAIVGCSDDGDDVPGSTAGSAGKGGGSTAGTGGKSTAGSNSTAGKGGTFGTAGDTSTAGGGTDGGGMAGTPRTGGTPPRTPDEQCDDADVCTDDTCVDGACKHDDNTAVCDDENACTSDDKCDAGECKGTNNTENCDDLSSCTPGQDKCADGKCGGPPDVAICPKCDVPENKILNCDFTKGDDPPGLESWETQFTFNGGGADQTVINERDVIDIRVGGSNSWTVQPLQKALTLKQGMKYKVRIVAGASIDRQITVSITRFDPDYQVYSDGGSKYGGWDLDLTQQMKFFERDFRFTGMVGAMQTTPPAGDEPNAKIEIKVGNREFEEPVPDFAGTSVYFDDVYLAEVPCTGDGECDDMNDCTTDKCEQSGVCSNAAVADDTVCAADEDACTNDVCKVGKCEHPVADDGAPCTDDADECTVDECVVGKCEHNFDNVACGCKKDEDCNDNKPCTDDTCNLETGACETAFNTAVCDDSNGCTSNDVCDGAGNCAGTGDIALTCVDTNACTVDNMCTAQGTCGAGTNMCIDCKVPGNVLNNCDFSAGLDGWYMYFAKNDTATAAVQDGMLAVTVLTKTGPDAGYEIQPLQGGIILTEGVTYTVKFNAYATIDRPIVTSLTMDNDPYASVSGPQPFNITTEMATYTFDYEQVGPPPTQKIKMEFDLGGMLLNPSVPNTVFIDNVTIAPKDF